MRKVIAISLLALGFGFALYINSKDSSNPFEEESLVPSGKEEKRLSTFSLQQEKNKDSYLQAANFVDEGRYQEAKLLIAKNKHLIESQDSKAELWAKLLAEISAKQRDPFQLRLLWQIHPKSVVGNQEAALVLASSFVDSLNYDSYLELRKSFVGKQEEDPRWVFLDVDKLLFEGKRGSAISLLERSSFEGKNEVERLLTLAKLALASKPMKAWNFLQQAQSISPQDPEIFGLQAKLLEMGEKYEVAKELYNYACRYSVNQALAREQLGSFYVRQGDFLRASELFQKSIEKEEIDIATKALFWSKVASSKGFEVEKIPSDLLKDSFLQYLSEIKPWEFWNQERFTDVVLELQLPSSTQAAMWLKLLHYLKQGEETKALAFLEKEAILEDCWDPGLLLAIAKTLSFRENGSCPPFFSSLYQGRMDKLSMERQQKTRTLVPKITSLDFEREACSDKRFSALLRSPRIWNYLLADASWCKAAVEVGNLSHIPLGDAPKEIQDKLVVAIKQTCGQKSALAFLQLLEESDSVLFEKGMIYLSEGNYGLAEQVLQTVSRYPNTFGEQACLALARTYLEQEKIAKAYGILRQKEHLAETLLGKELYARIALKEGKELVAEEIYHSIADQSLEAKSYFAMRAYEQKQWQKAYDYTLELLQDLPKSKPLKENLKKIKSKIDEQNQYS